MNDDGQLIDQTLAGQSAAFGQLVRKYEDRLYNTLLHVVGHADDARDIVQEAFVQAFVKLETFRRSSAFFTWLYRIGFNTAVSHRRRRRVASSLDRGRELSGAEPADPGEDPSARLEREERCRQVRQAIAELSEEHRVILVLREIDGCCYETIGEILDLPIGTVRSRLHRARIELRNVLKEMLTIDQ